jgi:hypothetical protein
MLASPMILPALPPPRYAAPTAVPSIGNAPMMGQVAAPPIPPWQAAPSATQQMPRPIIRAKAADEPTPPPPPRPSVLTLPSPESLGVTASAAPNASDADWTAVLHRRLKGLGATCFQVEQLNPGSECRITCLLPTRDPGRTHRIEARAASEAEAVRLALAQAEDWAGKQ